jgi:hypothetical protein
MSRLIAAALTLLICRLAGGAPAPLPHPGAKDGEGRVLIAHGKGYAIHAVPRATPLVPRAVLWVGRKFPAVPGLAVVHTSTATGEKKQLVRGGEWSYPGPPMGIDRIYHHRARVLGITCDSQRLYVLRWEARATTLDLPNPRPTAFGKGDYHLLVFRRADGKQLHEHRFAGGDLPPAPPEECSGRGPLRPRAGGVSCFGTAFEFQGEKLIRQGPEKARP